MFEEDLLRRRGAGLASDGIGRRSRSTARAPWPDRTPRRCTERWCSASATTCARTGSATSSSACRAASTRRWSRRSPPTRSGPERRPAARDAVARTPRPRASRTPIECARRLGIRLDMVPIDGRRSTRTARTLADLFAGTERGRRRGEPAGAHPRQPADGAVEQVRLDGARDREQERVRRGLRHALRRHGRRVRADQGRARRRSSTSSPRGGTRSGPRRAADPRARS